MDKLTDGERTTLLLILVLGSRWARQHLSRAAFEAQMEGLSEILTKLGFDYTELESIQARFFKPVDDIPDVLREAFQ